MFLDTSGLLCYLHRDEPPHSRAVALFDAGQTRLTHNYVIAEFVALATARRLPRAASLSFVTDLIEHPDIEVVWVTQSLHRDGTNLLMTQLDKSYSLADAISFLIMRERAMLDALTTDRHFSQAGFHALLAS
ncbi:MAG: type II toxin-antitoxin system VapC family toxin [Phycisphaerales bacterium]|nr:type II toxin-antitoxin system VapC family toxin [Phycisphaerales bacterium]